MGLLPTSTPFARSWSITLQCTLFPQEQKNRIYDFDYDFSEVVFDPNRFVVSFNGPVQGVAFIGENKDVINLQHNLTYTYNFEQRKLSFSLRIPCSIHEPTTSFLNMYIDDSEVVFNGFFLIYNPAFLTYLTCNDGSLNYNSLSSLFTGNNPTWFITQAPQLNAIPGYRVITNTDEVLLL